MDSVESYRPVVQSTTGDHEVLRIYLDTCGCICRGCICHRLDTLGASTFDAAFDAYVLVRVTRSCLAVQESV